VSAGSYSIGSPKWPGLSKLIEECGEVLQVAGKIIATNGDTAHWDGTDLAERLTEELADLQAAIGFMIGHNPLLDADRVMERAKAKADLFCQWHNEDPS
jgi:NTP pyrophosphatase (non-canonical NTP hydrolase)